MVLEIAFLPHRRLAIRRLAAANTKQRKDPGILSCGSYDIYKPSPISYGTLKFNFSHHQAKRSAGCKKLDRGHQLSF